MSIVSCKTSNSSQGNSSAKGGGEESYACFYNFTARSLTRTCEEVEGPHECNGDIVFLGSTCKEVKDIMAKGESPQGSCLNTGLGNTITNASACAMNEPGKVSWFKIEPSSETPNDSEDKIVAENILAGFKQALTENNWDGFSIKGTALARGTAPSSPCAVPQITSSSTITISNNGFITVDGDDNVIVMRHAHWMDLHAKKGEECISLGNFDIGVHTTFHPEIESCKTDKQCIVNFIVSEIRKMTPDSGGGACVESCNGSQINCKNKIADEATCESLPFKTGVRCPTTRVFDTEKTCFPETELME